MAGAENESVSPASTPASAPAKKSEVPKAEEKISEAVKHLLLEERQRIIDRLKIIRKKCERNAGKESASSKLPEKQGKTLSEMTLENKKNNPPSSSTLPKQEVTPSEVEVISEAEKGEPLSDFPVKPKKTNTKDKPSSNSPAKKKVTRSSAVPQKMETSSNFPIRPKKTNTEDSPSSSSPAKKKVTRSSTVPQKMETSSNSPIRPEKTNTKDNPSSNSPAKKKVTRSSAVSQKVETVETQKIGVKRKAGVAALTANKKIRKEILFIDLTCDDVEELFPDKIKINLGHRCDSPAFRLGSINKGVPSTDHGSKVPVQRSSCSTDGAKADGKISIIKERGSIFREPLRLLLSSDRNKSSSEFKMIRVDYKKNAEQK